MHLYILSTSCLMKEPMAFPIAAKTLGNQKCNGRLWSLTQTGILETTIVEGSKPGNQGVMKRPALPQNHGPSWRAKSFSLTESNFTIKKPLEHKWMSQFGVHVEKIHCLKASVLGQNPLNLHMTASEERSE